MRKIVIIIVTISILAALLISCGTTTTTPAPASSTPAASKPPAASTPATSVPASTAPATSKPAATTPAPTTAVKGPKYGGTLTLISANGPGAPFGTPWLSTGASSINMQYSMEGPLKGWLDGSYLPFLATSYDVETDPAKPSITLHLRKGVKFTDGAEFNAKVIEWNLKKIMGPDSTYSGGTSNWKSLEVLDDYTFRLNLKVWQNTSVGAFAGATAFFASPDTFAKRGIDWMNWNMVGTGPFIQTDFKRDVSLSFIRNPDYWDKGKPYLDKINLLYVSDALTAEALWKTGVGDVLQPYSQLMIDNVMKMPGVKLSSSPSMGSSFVPDSANPDSPWSNVKFRMAAEYAIDKDALNKAFGSGSWEVLYQNAFKASAAYDPSLPARKYDVEKAKQLLKEAGYPSGVKTNIYVSPFSSGADLMTAIQAYWKAVGIDVTLQFPQAAAFSAMVWGTWKNGVLYSVGPAGGSNPNGGFGSMARGSAFYQSLKKPEGFEDAYQASLKAPKVDPALAKKVEKLLYDDCTTIPLSISASSWITRDYVTDHGLGTRDIFAWWEHQNTWYNK